MLVERQKNKGDIEEGPLLSHTSHDVTNTDVIESNVVGNVEQMEGPLVYNDEGVLISSTSVNLESVKVPAKMLKKGRPKGAELTILQLVVISFDTIRIRHIVKDRGKLLIRNEIS